MVFQDLLTNKDDYLRASRALLREIIKQTKHEINFQSFCFGLMQERKETSYVDMEFKVRSNENSPCHHFSCIILHLNCPLNCLSLSLSAGALCYPSDRFTDCLHDAGHHCSGQRSRHRMGQRREEESVPCVCSYHEFNNLNAFLKGVCISH